MRKKWLKWIVWAVFSPVLLFFILMILLYVPPVQDFLRKEATEYASKETGYNISVGRIDLRFPLNLLLRHVQIVGRHTKKFSKTSLPDTLLSFSSLNVRVQALPLFAGRVEVDEVTLKKVSVNSLELVKGMHVKGVLGKLSLESHGINPGKEEALVDKVELSDAHMMLALVDTTKTPEDKTKKELKWRVVLQRLHLKNVSVDYRQPFDSTRLATRIVDAGLSGGVLDLRHAFYGLKKLQVRNGYLNYDVGKSLPSKGFDPSHIALRDIMFEVDSVILHKQTMNAVIRQFILNERSGLNVSSLTGRCFVNSSIIRIPNLSLLTPHSELNFSFRTDKKIFKKPFLGHLETRLDGRIGSPDAILLLGGLPDEFKKAYPFRPLTLHVGLKGDLQQLDISRLMVDLPGAFSISGKGKFNNLGNNLKRKGHVDLNMSMRNLQFLVGIAGFKPGGNLAVPDSMNLKASIGLDGLRYNADVALKERGGTVKMVASCNTTKRDYQAKIFVDALQLHHFLPKDSLYELSAEFTAKGSGFNPLARKSYVEARMSLKHLQYGRWHISDVDLNALIKNAYLKANLKSNNTLLKMEGNCGLSLGTRYLDGNVQMAVEQLDIYKLGFASQPLRRPFAFNLQGQAHRDSISVKANAGDLDLDFRSHNNFQTLLKQTNKLATVLKKQIKARYLDHGAIRKVLPTAGIQLRMGKNNPVSDFLATKDIRFNDFLLRFGMTPRIGINGRTAIHGLRVDSLQLDTLYFTVRQDTSRMNLQGGIINGPKNPQYVFRSTLTGEIRNNDADLSLNFLDSKGNVGLQIGVNARPVLGGQNKKADGILFRLTPDEPIIAFRKFHFIDHNNWIYLHKNMRVYASVDMMDKDNVGFRMHSIKEDSVSLQNMDIELRRIRLDEVSRILPYFPDFSGRLSAETHYIQTATSLQISTEANVEKLTYEGQHVGNVGIGVTWLPGESGTHYLNSYFTCEGKEVMTAEGTLKRRGANDSIRVESHFDHFPISLANPFIPERLVSFNGDVDGGVNISGTLGKPDIDGELKLDSVTLYARQAGARYHFDNRPVYIKNNQLLFDKFAIYTTSKNPFTIDGNIDFRDLRRPVARLDLLARKYTLLDAPRTRESLIYGKVYVDMKGTIRGPLDALVMRGSMNLLGNTDVTYVMADSPLTVEDRLEGLVTFTSFRDTTLVKAEPKSIGFAGMDMLMAVHIDNAVRLRADLSYDRSKFVELEGGGDLSLHYTPQGDINLTGRYVLSGGTMKYSLPVIPLKEFNIVNGSYVDWSGSMMNPSLNLTATERVRASVADGDNGASRMVNFDISVSIRNRLEKPDLLFDISAPDDPTVENQLAAMGAEERSRQAIAMLVTGVYLNNTGKSNMNMGNALNSVLQSQISALAGAAFGNFSVGIENHNGSQPGDNRGTDYSFRYSQRFFNDRVQVVIGGKVSTGSNATNDTESFIDNISLEYRLDTSGSRYIRVFHNKNYESVLDGEITETGVGVVFRKRMDNLGELFIFKRRNKEVKDKK